METTQTTGPAAPVAQVPSTASPLTPEIVENLQVKIPAGGQTTRFTNANPFKLAEHAHATTAPQPQSVQAHPATNAAVAQAKPIHKPVFETVMIICLAMGLCAAVLILYR